MNNQGGPEPQWEVGLPKQVSLQVSGKILAANAPKKSDFYWNSEAEQAFKHLKQHISELPMLVAPRPKKELIMYLSASHGAVGAVLMTERDTIQTPVYFVSRALQGAELNYTLMEKLILALPWTLFTDGSSCVDGSGARLILTSPEGTELTYALKLQFAASNNEAEYEALIVELRIAAQMGVRNVQVSVDSKHVANQVLGTYIAKEDNMIKYLEKSKSLVGGFDSFYISQVPRSKNKKADALSKIASTSFVHLSKQVLVEILKEKSIQEKEVAAVVEEEGPTWMTPILEYLKDGTLPDDRKKASKLRIKSRQYELWEGILYRRSFLKPWLSMHTGPRSVVAKAMRSGYYWPTMHRDARDMILKCKDCQVKFLIVAMDYFTKWIEEKAVAIISGTQVKKFMWDNIVCHFGLPGEIVSDNGKQFSGDPFKDWCKKLNIIQHFASLKHPQSNGLVERENSSLGEGIKARLGEGNKNWLEELPHVLWAHRMMIKSSNDDTPFSLAYRTEAIIPIPAENRMPNNPQIRGDFVYRSNDASHAVDGGKLGPIWEGPYEVMESTGD
ncbi:reverse transcriptase domain-containing protein [Tanacetum coccineum]